MAFYYSNKNNRFNETLTTFIRPTEPRRNQLLATLAALGFDHKNINNCFDTVALRELYCNTKILINIHQTLHHHTFEELRVLPALLCGVLVISEEIPLKSLIPYKDYIIWSSYEKIAEKVIEVSENYEFYHDMIFGGSNELLTNLHFSNLERLKTALLSLSR